VDKRIEKYFDGQLNSKDRINLLNEIDVNEELRKDFVSMKNIHGIVSLRKTDEDAIEGLNKYKDFANNFVSESRPSAAFKIMRYVAAIAAVMVVTWFATLQYNGKLSDSLQAYNTITVPAGQRASVELNDGTTVWLNAKSTLIYPSQFGNGERQVKLIGEGYFTVAKDQERPFVVSAGAVDVRVLGTTFDVFSYPEVDSVSVALLEGSVEIFNPQKLQVVKLEPQQYAVYKNGEISLKKLINDDNFLWKQGIYSFEKTPLSEIVNKLELYYDTRIIIKNPKIAANTYTGKFRQRDGVMEILNIIQKIHKFTIEKDEEKNIYILK